MKKLGIAGAALSVVGLVACAASEQSGGAADWKDNFTVAKSRLAGVGRNPYFILEPGYKLTFAAGKETLVITVLEETEVVDGVTTRVVEERETEKGQLAEVSRNFFAIDPGTGDVYYFGEDVDEYKDEKIIGHEGAWRAGVNGAKFGLMMPGTPKVGDKYYQESAPKIAMDRAEVVGLAETLETPAGTFKDCLRVKETSAIEKGSSLKIYAPGIGLIKDDEFVLAKVEKGESDEAKEAVDPLPKPAKITMDKAREPALQQAQGKVASEELELEDEDGYLVYNVTVKFNGENYEVLVDAGSGKVVGIEIE